MEVRVGGCDNFSFLFYPVLFPYYLYLYQRFGVSSSFGVDHKTSAVVINGETEVTDRNS